jgi:hypothetical protein
MRFHLLGNGTRVRVSVLSTAALLAVCGSATASGPLHLGGTWKGTYSGAFSGTFRIHWTQVGTKLTGSISLSRPKGTYTITGSVAGRRIHFGAVGVGATYTGSASGSSMSGSFKTPQGGGTWSAQKAS